MKTATELKTKLSLKKTTDPLSLLRRVLHERCQKNPQYSIRAFSRASGISHTVLSLALSGKRRLSKKAAAKLADYLMLDHGQRQKILQNYQAPEQRDFQALSLDSFEVISDWYHYAILSALELPNAKFEARWLSKQLSITLLESKLAMERLQRLGLVAQDDLGVWRQSTQPIKIDNSNSVAATRKFHKQLLERAAVSIDQDAIAVRDFSSMTFAMNASQVEYAREKIQKFRWQLMQDLEQRGTPEAVFNMTIQLYPVTAINKNTNKNISKNMKEK